MENLTKSLDGWHRAAPPALGPRQAAKPKETNLHSKFVWRAASKKTNYLSFQTGTIHYFSLYT